MGNERILRDRGVEWLCLAQCLRFSWRHRRYLAISSFLYAHSLRHWKNAKMARYGFCFLQLFDDIMDGDRRSVEKPEDVALKTVQEWRMGMFREGTPLSRLGAALQAAIEMMPAVTQSEAKDSVAQLLKAMAFDEQRVRLKLVLDEDELSRQLKDTFHHSVNILLIAAGCRTRAAEVSLLVAALAWCSVVRDWDEDLRKGLINVPKEVAIFREDGKIDTEAIQVREWLYSERVMAKAVLKDSWQQLDAVAQRDKQAFKLLSVFQRSVEKYAR